MTWTLPISFAAGALTMLGVIRWAEWRKDKQDKRALIKPPRLRITNN